MFATTSSHRSAVAFATAFAVVLAMLMIQPAEEARATHGPCVLDVQPDFNQEVQGYDHDLHTVGQAHTMTAVLLLPDPTGGTAGICRAVATVNIDAENEGGPHDPDGFTHSTPDYTCDIPPGQSSCEFGFTGTRTGTDVIRAWIDHDGIQSNPDDDRTEGIDERVEPGAGRADCNAGVPEPDCTDVTAATWIGGPPAALDCDDPNGPDTERETNPSGGGSASNEVYTCTARDVSGNPSTSFDPVDPESSERINVYGEVENGINDPDPDDSPGAAASYRSPDYGCVIAGSGPTAGSCNITVTQNELEEGTAEICFWISQSQDPDAPGGAGEQGHRLCADPSPDTPEDDPEPTGEQQTTSGGIPGSDVANDPADQVEKSWVSSTGNVIDAEPEAASNATGDPHTITVYFFDQFGQPAAGNRTASFEFIDGSVSDTDDNTPQSPDGLCTTNGSDRCSFTYTSNVQGQDVICVWTASQPTISGTTSSPTCDGEGPNDADDDPNVPDMSAPNDDQDVVQKIWQSTTAPSRLNCEPERGAMPIGSTHSIRCTATSSVGALASGVAIDVEASGANDVDGDSVLTPDFSCDTGADGSCTVSHTTNQNATAGTTTYRGWIDADNNNATPEADTAEGRDDATAPGARAEPDDTDVTENVWGNPSPSPSPTATATTSPTSPTTTRPPTQTACPGCQFGRTISLTATKNRVRFGSSFTLTGRVAADDASAPASCTNGVAVAILRDELGDAQQTFTQVGTATTGSAGAFAVNFQADKNAIYIAKVNANSPPGCNEATSAPESVLVRVKVALRTSKRSVQEGGRVRFRARVSPCAGHENDNIVLFASTGGKLGRVAKKRSSSSCTATFRRRVRQRTVFQARWPRQDDDHLQGKSRRKTVRVR